MSYKFRTSGLVQFNDTDAHFRGWVQAISDGLQTGGLTKTADSGQINTATVTKPGGTSTSQGYEIRQFTDALSGTKPVVFKIEYGSGTGSANEPAIWLTIGTGSDGSGNITGTTLLARTMIRCNGATSSSVSFAINVDTSRFTLAMNAYTASTVTAVNLERSKDSSLADSNEGLILDWFFATAGSFRYLPFVGTIPTAETDGGAIHPSTDTTVAGSDVGVFPMNPTNFGFQVNSPLGWQCYRTNEITSDTIITVNIDGSNHDYLALGQRCAVSTRTGNNPGMLMRYE